MKSSARIVLATCILLALGTLYALIISANADWGRQIITPPELNITKYNMYDILPHDTPKQNVTLAQNQNGILAQEVVPTMPKPQNSLIMERGENNTTTYKIDPNIAIKNLDSNYGLPAKYGSGLITALGKQSLINLVANANWSNHSQAEDLKMTPQEWDDYMDWMQKYDTIHNKIWEENEYVCYNFTIDSLKESIQAGFTHLYFVHIENSEENSGHAVIGAHVVSSGSVLLGLPSIDEWVIMDPQDLSIINDELKQNKFNDSVSFFSPYEIFVVGWSINGGILSKNYHAGVVHQEYI